MTGLKSTTSNFSVTETETRLIRRIEEKGWHVFARIDHAEQAINKGLALRPTRLVLFGNPKVGTFLMQDEQSVAIDLPVKVLIFENEQGSVQIVYNAMDWLKKRHHLTDEVTLKTINRFLETLCDYASKEQHGQVG